MVGTGNDHVTAARCKRRASRENVHHSKLHIRMVNAFRYDRPSTDSGLDHFALILPNNPQYQLGRSVSYGSYRRTTHQPVFFAKSHV